MMKLMPSSYKMLITILVLILGVSYTAWLAKQTSVPMLKTPLTTQHPDAFMNDFSAVEMDKNGKPHSTLHASKLIHYPLHNTAILQDPYFILYSDNATPWHIKAKQGRSIHNQQRIDLKQDVVVQQLTDDQQAQTTLTTSAITIYPQRHYADTTEYVELTESDVSLQGIGMHAFLKEKRIQLLNNVRGTHYEVN